ncbi:DUF397 domain-containing protein [Streptomyces sp. NBC_00264]|uniref:DUF397 domain-containing protein n=1 Tax=unclassified Streptomyces TaxID=2593676 RepID=UPI002254B49A|nr:MULTISPECIES: DUF397 domain-containing protein [unclassified Streptomyces]MCX5162139.1 DUF397 domain-containing protein [Streptomyces sp. NBC_00305]MCX5220656.1 DUF397 domain-containing protein [Streptomyces sp. NBC_00264]
MIRKTFAGDASELKWFKSSYSSSGDGNDCVEVAATPGTVHVRDSKNAPGPRFAVTLTAWADFVNYASAS